MDITTLSSYTNTKVALLHKEFIVTTFCFSIVFLIGFILLIIQIRSYPITDYYLKMAARYLLINTFVRAGFGIFFFIWYMTGDSNTDAEIAMRQSIFDAFTGTLFYEIPFYLTQMCLLQLTFSTYSFFMRLRELMGIESKRERKERELLSSNEHEQTHVEKAVNTQRRLEKNDESQLKLKTSSKRLDWLVISLMGGLIAVWLIGFFAFSQNNSELKIMLIPFKVFIWLLVLTQIITLGYCI